MKNRFLSLVLLAVLIILLSGCSQADPTQTQTVPQASPIPGTALPPATALPALTPTPTVVQGTVRIWHAWDEDSRPVLAEIISGFQELYPNVQFDVLYIPIEDLRQRYEESAREQGGPTLLFAPGEWGPTLYDSGLITDLSASVSPAVRESLSPPAVGAGLYRDAQIGLPYAQQGAVLYRNPTIVPFAPETAEDLISMAARNTVGDKIGAYLDRSFYFGGGHLIGIGGQLMDKAGLPAFNTVKGVEWIELLRTFEQAGPVDFQTDQDLELFKQGRVGMIVDGTWNLTAIKDALGEENLKIDAWPLYQAGALAGFTLAENAYLNPRVEGAELLAAKKFLEYLLSPDAQTILASSGRLPTSKDAKVSDLLMEQALRALAGNVTYPVVPPMAAYPSQMDIALYSVFEDGQSPAIALQVAEQSILAALATPTP